MEMSGKSDAGRLFLLAAGGVVALALLEAFLAALGSSAAEPPEQAVPFAGALNAASVGAAPAFCTAFACQPRLVASQSITPSLFTRVRSVARSCSAASSRWFGARPCSARNRGTSSWSVSFDRAPGVVQVVALGDRGHHGHRPHPRMILTVRARSLVHWCDAQPSKIRMRDSRAKISDCKIGNSEIQGRNTRLTRAGRR
jgi:hypothetical protein